MNVKIVKQDLLHRKQFLKSYQVRSERGDLNSCGKWSIVLPLMLQWSLAWFPYFYSGCPWPQCVDCRYHVTCPPFEQGVVSNSKWKMGQNVLAFSEYLNFSSTRISCTLNLSKSHILFHKKQLTALLTYTKLYLQKNCFFNACCKYSFCNY